MNLTTLGGLVGFWGVVFTAMILAYSLGAYVDTTSIVIVFGGTTAAIFFGFDTHVLKQFGPAFKQTFKPTIVDYTGTIRKIIEISVAFKKGGVETLEDDLIPNEEDKFLVDLMKSISNNMEVEDVEEVFYLQIEALEERHKAVQGMIQEAGSIAGSTGMIGTLIGLVAMLLNMSDPSAIGPAMAVALLTTLYGALIGTGLANPVAIKLGLKTDVEKKTQELKVKGVVYLLQGDNPRIIEQKLFALIPVNERVSYWA